MLQKHTIVMETERMILRKLNMDDLDSLFLIFSDKKAYPYTSTTKDRNQTEESLQTFINWYEERGFGFYACVLRGTNEFAGICGHILQLVEGKQEVEIGYHFLRKFWNRGLATEAAIACREYAFNELGIHRVISLIDPGNIPSIRVALKNGMTLEKQVNMEKWDKTVNLYVAQQNAKD